MASQMSNFEKKPEESWSRMAKAVEKEVPSTTASRQECDRITTEIFEKYGNRKQKRGGGEGAGVVVEERSRKRRPTRRGIISYSL